METSLQDVFAAHDEGKAAVITAREWVARFRAEYDAAEDVLLRVMSYETHDDQAKMGSVRTATHQSDSPAVGGTTMEVNIA